jgi:succinate-semialdehyde dehydrogenase / glutarate-semialdehyde dehydrogenase
MKMLIDSQWVEASDGRRGDVINPGTGETIDSVPLARLVDAHRALQAAQSGKEAMRNLHAHQRAAILLQIANAMQAHQEELCRLLAQENGKPIAQTRAEVLRPEQPVLDDQETRPEDPEGLKDPQGLT